MNKIIVLAMCSLILVSCNTVHGVGKDLEKAGEAVQKSTQ